MRRASSAVSCGGCMARRRTGIHRSTCGRTSLSVNRGRLVVAASRLGAAARGGRWMARHWPSLGVMPTLAFDEAGSGWPLLLVHAGIVDRRMGSGLGCAGSPIPRHPPGSAWVRGDAGLDRAVHQLARPGRPAAWVGGDAGVRDRRLDRRVGVARPGSGRARADRSAGSGRPQPGGLELVGSTGGGLGDRGGGLAAARSGRGGMDERPHLGRRAIARR